MALSGPINVTTANYGKLLDSEAKLTASRCNVAQQQFQTPHRSTKFLLGRQLHVNSGFAEETTPARAVATRSIWNAVLFAAMNCAMRSLVVVHLIAKRAASQFKVGNCSYGRVEVKYIVDGAQPAGLKSVADNNGIVAYFIKYFLLIFADGSSRPPVYVISDASMPADVIDCYTIPGLEISTDVMSTGYVVFCRTRCANQAFFAWLNEAIIFTAIRVRKVVFGLDPDVMTWFQLGGEPVQIAIYQSEQMQKKLENMNIVVGKPPASTTEITQPCDIRHCFKGPKTALKHINDSDVDEYQKLAAEETGRCL